jgi:hypothetical protein
MLASAWLLMLVADGVISTFSNPIADPRIYKEGSHRLDKVLRLNE